MMWWVVWWGDGVMGRWVVGGVVGVADVHLACSIEDVQRMPIGARTNVKRLPYLKVGPEVGWRGGEGGRGFEVWCVVRDQP